MYDVLIVGAGPAGMSAAIYVQRAGKSSIVLDEKGYGGQIVNTREVENYPGVKSVSGPEFARGLFEQASSLGATIRVEKVTGIQPQEDGTFDVISGSETRNVKAVILATGVKNRKMNVDGETRLTGSGVSFCATCDGNFFRGQQVAVVGGGDTALEDAETLAGLCEKVYLVHRRDQFRGSATTVERLKKMVNVEFVLSTLPVRIEGESVVEGLRVQNQVTGAYTVLPVSGVFVAVGQDPDNKAFAALLDLDKAGYIVGSEDCRTSKPGIFVAGDCRTKKVRQLTTAAADGAVAALAAVEYVNEHQ